MEPSDHLFRHEAGRMVATLTRIFGVHNLALAEDVVQDAFCRALEVWKFRGVPENPSAWLMATAKNRALDVLRRERNARTFAPELGRLLESEWTLVPSSRSFLDASAIKDDQLRMMFSCCHPRLPEEAQVALVLHILCGFSVGEIAECVCEQQRCHREAHLARQESAGGIQDAVRCIGRRRLLAAPSGRPASTLFAIQRRLSRRVRRVGGACRAVPRGDASCGAASEHPLAATPATYALAALMGLHAARLPARVDASGNLSSLFDQDRSRWDSRLVTEGQRFLDLSATGPELTEYHVEAAIASVHAMAHRTEDTDWGKIVSLYDTLMRICPSPVVALNRAIAIAQHEGPKRGLERFAQSSTTIASPPTLSTMRRSASSNFTREVRQSRASTSERRSLSRAIPWSDNSSRAAHGCV